MIQVEIVLGNLPVTIESDRWIERVSQKYLAEMPLLAEQLHNHGWCKVYTLDNQCQTIWVRWWLALILERVSRWRDEIAWRWGMHCLDMGLIREGDFIPWPKCLTWWWNG